jgi:uncharacterized membrane protein (DUF373 family)
MFKIIELCEKFIIVTLMVIMIIAMLLMTVELGWIMVEKILSPPLFMLGIEELFELFGFFMMVLIGIELLQSIKMYITSNQLHVELVFMVAMIAIARKVIVLDAHDVSGLSLLGVAATIIALSGSYFLVKKADKPDAARDTTK